QHEIGMGVVVVGRRLAIHEDGAHHMAARPQALADHIGHALGTCCLGLRLDLDDLHAALSRGTKPASFETDNSPAIDGSMPIERRQISTPHRVAVITVPAVPRPTPSGPSSHVSRAVMASPTML